MNKGKHYSLLTKLNYMTKYRKKFRKSVLKVMEGWEEDLEDKLHENIANCYNEDGTVKTVQAQLAQNILAKKEQNHLLSLMCPFSAISNLIPSGIDIGERNFYNMTKNRT